MCSTQLSTTQPSPKQIDKTKLLDQISQRRLWYHNIELIDGMRTRFEQDYEVNPVLRRVDTYTEELVNRLEGIFPASFAGMNILDLGCADGLLSVWAARRGASRVVGIERNKYNYEHALFVRDILSLNQIELFQGSIEKQCPQENFDVVLCCGLLYHLLDPLGALHLLRQRCRGKLIITSAVDLDDSSLEPLSRLDRYATGAHGMWSFNTAMIRQLISTAGFDLAEEVIEARSGGRHYIGVATPGEFSDHHIFEETLDQEFPVNVDRRRNVLRDLWTNQLCNIKKPIALFGAGTHTPWLLQQVADLDGVNVACVLDDRVSLNQHIEGLPVCRPTDIDPKQFGAIVISSWHQGPALYRRAKTVFTANIPIISIGSDMDGVA